MLILCFDQTKINKRGLILYRESALNFSILKKFYRTAIKESKDLCEKLEDLENLMFKIFSEITNNNRIHGNSEDIYAEIMNMNKSDKMLQS